MVAGFGGGLGTGLDVFLLRQDCSFYMGWWYSPTTILSIVRFYRNAFAPLSAGSLDSKIHVIKCIRHGLQLADLRSCIVA